MTIADAILWPGTRICLMLGIKPDEDAGLIRTMFNMIIYLTVFLGVMWWLM